MPVPKNLVWEQSSSTGTGNKTLARYGGFARVSEAFGTGDAGSANPVLFFANKDATSAEWEVVQGYMSDANTFVPGTVLASSNGGSAVTFTAGTKYVTNDVPAAYQVYLDSNAASPPTNDGAALGRATVSWSDLYLASGGQINWNNSTAYLYESSGNLIWNGGDFDMRKTGSSPALVTARQDTHGTGIAVGSLYHKGRDSGGTAKTYAITQGYCDGNTPSSENGSLHYQVMKAGTVTDVATLSGAAYMPTTSDGIALGSTSKMWSDLFLALGGVINWNNGDVTATHAANALSFAGASSGYSFDAVLTPSSNDGAALGASGTAWSDVFLANGAVINFNAGTYTLTQSGSNLATNGGVYLNDSTAAYSGVVGWSLTTSGSGHCSVSAAPAFWANRNTSDGAIVYLLQDGTTEGSISVSGTTITYGAFCGSHWSQLSDGGILDIPRGTIVETIDDMCSWPGEENDQLARFKVSDTPGSSRVYGVFLDWHAEDLDSNDAMIASLGAYLVRIADGVTVQRGDLIESNGDGCGRVQADDIVRTRTVCKVTSNHIIETYSDGSYLVPCVLYCG